VRPCLCQILGYGLVVTPQAGRQSLFRAYRRRREQQRRRRAHRYAPGPFAVGYTLLLILGTSLVASTYWALDHFLTDGRGLEINDRLDAVRISLTAVGGAGAVAALYVAYRKQRNEEAGHNREQDRLFTDRFTKAAEQLGHESPAVRLAGVYALARIADDSPRDRETCMKTLAAYLRMPYSLQSNEAGEDQVRLTIVRVITERLRPENPEIFWEGAELDLRGAVVQETDFSRIRVEGWAKFDGATFEGFTDFNRVQFIGPASFEDTEFQSHAMFGATDFWSSADFGGACFSGTVHFLGVFNGYADFKGAKFKGGGSFGWKFVEGGDFSDATFLHLVEFCSTIFEGATDFTGTQFEGQANFLGARFLGNVNFDTSNFTGRTTFAHSKFAHRAEFRAVRFAADCDFSKVICSNTITFYASRMTNAFQISAPGTIFLDFRGVDLSDCSPSVDAARVFYNAKTKLPVDFVLPDGWVEMDPDDIFTPDLSHLKLP
jgi:uncharacterized protein YjbI with pentapeptide repeats